MQLASSLLSQTSFSCLAECFFFKLLTKIRYLLDNQKNKLSVQPCICFTFPHLGGGFYPCTTTEKVRKNKKRSHFPTSTAVLINSSLCSRNVGQVQISPRSCLENSYTHQLDHSTIRSYNRCWGGRHINARTMPGSR